jgi:CRP-like cAMP-binding protein
MGAISDIDLFAGLGEESARRYGAALAWRNYPENELVIDLDDPSNDVLFVVTGAVRVIHRAEDGKQVILGELGAGAFSARWRRSTARFARPASPRCRNPVSR